MLEVETAIKCPGLTFSNNSRLSLVDLNNIPSDLTDNSELFSVRITMIGRCKEMSGENRCNLTKKECIFKELPIFDRIDFEDDSFEDDEFFDRADY